MAWAPQKQVIDLSQIADNLLGYIEANQVEVLDWASNGDGLTPFAKFYTNASGRLQTIFPSLMILNQTCETDLAGDKGIESILANIPSADLTANSDPIMTAALFEIETRLDILRGQQSPTAFLQIFQTRCVFRLTASAF
jgi:hypothetical protein